MKSPLHILHLEDDPNDAALIQSTLEAGGIICATTCVQSHDDFVAALEHGGIDLILSDFSLPAFDGLSALEMVRTKWPAIPLILVSGMLGEERAIDSLKRGATDYVLKERLARLVPAVHRAMQEVEERTERRRLEEEFIQAQKMEVVGQLAGGVAHDFNNILTVIHGHASLLLTSELEESASRSAQQISQAAERAAALTRQLLTFSRRQLIQPKKLDMNKIVGNMIDLLGRLLGEDVSLQLNYCPSPAMVKADVGMMEQVLLNLAVNARDAMPKGGRLAVRISIVDLNEAHVQHHPEARVGRFVCVSKTDTGCGIPPENLQRIFEPFFTTKEVGKGTGLGLATVYGIVKQHQGWIEVESTVGTGTTFRIYVPYVGSAEAETEKPTTQITIRGGNETILLVEDEKPVRELVSRILQKYGYKILPAGSGAEAIESWSRHKDEIALLFTDLVMPDNMNGRELAEKLWAERPGLKVIFTSGYSADIVGKDFKLEPELNYLQKPYPPQVLALAVRRCLDDKQAE